MTRESCGSRVNLTADTNVLLRLILNDSPGKTSAVQDFLAVPESVRGAVELHTTTVSEFVYVLGSSHQGFARAAIARALEVVLALPFRIVEPEVIRVALDFYRSVHSDWDDCVVAAYAVHRTAGRLLSYDRDLRRIPGLDRFEPPMAAS